MSLDHILLGILRTPASGYEIKQHLDQVFAHFWAADLPQIYRTLNRMEREGQLTVSPEPSEKGPGRRVYARTQVGGEELRTWLLAAPRLDVERNTLLGRAAFLGELDDDRTALDTFHRFRAETEQALGALQAIAREWAAADPDYPDCRNGSDFYLQLTLDARIQELTTQVAWASRCIHRLGSRLQASERPA